MKHVYCSFIALLLSIAVLQGNAQTVPKGFELSQLLRIAELYRHQHNLTFNINYSLSDSAAPNTILQQLSGTTSMSDGKYWTLLDSTEFVVGFQNTVSFYHKEKIIVVGDRQPYGDFLKVPFMDSVFRRVNLDHITIAATDDTTNLLTVIFKPTSMYSAYKMS